MLKAIYKPKGRAQEYKEWACNLYRGCGHGCVYCYAPKQLFMERADFANAKPRADILLKLTKDCVELYTKGESLRVLLCFTTDPYQPIEEEYHITRQAIMTLQAYGQAVTILTKGGARSMRDIELLRPGLDEYATTLTFLSPFKSAHWEPFAAWPGERISALKKAHDLGIYTWASLEPVIDPQESLEIIRVANPWVDEFKLGVLNYHPRAASIDWRKYAKEAIALVKETGRKVYIKHDLKKYI